MREGLAGEELPPSEALAAVLRYHRHWRAGFLPAAGGIGDQNRFLMDCIEAADDAYREHERLEMDDQWRWYLSARAGKGRERKGGVTARFDGAPPGRRGFRPGWRAHRRPAR